MAIPTDFKGPTPAANTTKSFKLFGSTTVGLWVLDIDGTLSATTNVIPLGPNLAIIADQAYTDAQLIPLIQDWLARMGGRHEGAGGQAAETTKQVAVTATTCT
jgi:hypothetical protein